MKEWVGLLVIVAAYSLSMVLLGGLIEKQWIGARIYVIADKQWRDGCEKCAQFEINECERNQLQGVPSKPKEIY